MGDSDPIIHIYRGFEFKYANNNNNTISNPSNICKCPCDGFDECRGLDAIRYDNLPKTKNKSEQCLVCEDLKRAVEDKVINDPSIRQMLTKGRRQYRSKRRDEMERIRERISILHDKRDLFEKQAMKIRALKEKIHVATEVLHTATGKLSNLSSSFNTLEQQNGLQYQDKVQVGIPYLPPFFTLSNRNYVIMMVCINVLLLIGIIVYAFRNQVRTDFDVVSTDSKTATDAPVDSTSKAEPTDKIQPSTTTTSNRTRGGILNERPNDPNTLSGINGHLYQS